MFVGHIPSLSGIMRDKVIKVVMEYNFIVFMKDFIFLTKYLMVVLTVCS